MGDCQICKVSEWGLKVNICEVDPLHLIHITCLQAFVDQIGADISALNCPECGSHRISIMKILMNPDLTVPEAWKEEMGAAIARRKMIEGLRDSERLA